MCRSYVTYDSVTMATLQTSVLCLPPYVMQGLSLMPCVSQGPLHYTANGYRQRMDISSEWIPSIHVEEADVNRNI